MDNLSSQLQASCGFTSGEVHMLLQGSEKLIAQCHQHTTHLSNVPNGSMDENTITILDYYSKQMKLIRALQTRLKALLEELNRKKLSVAHNA